MRTSLEYESKQIFRKFNLPLVDRILNEEEKTVWFLKNYSKNPTVSYIAGKSAPEGKGMGHDGTIISGDFRITKEKIKTLKHIGVLIADTAWDVPK